MTGNFRRLLRNLRRAGESPLVGRLRALVERLTAELADARDELERADELFEAQSVDVAEATDEASRLLAALAPFARFGRFIEACAENNDIDHPTDAQPVVSMSMGGQLDDQIVMGDFRRAMSVFHEGCQPVEDTETSGSDVGF